MPKSMLSSEKWVRDREVFREATPEGVHALFLNWQLDNAHQVRRIVPYRIKEGPISEYSMVVQFERKARS